MILPTDRLLYIFSLSDTITKINISSTCKKCRDDLRDSFKIPTTIQLSFLEDVRDGSNIILTGPAGCGKTYCLQRLRTKYPESIIFTATTGVGANLIQGITIDYLTTYLKKSDEIPDQYKEFTSLVIDECSMMGETKLLDIDLTLREAFTPSKYFGGIQVILTGDFLQLPPVQDTCFLFSRYFQEMMFKIIYVRKSMRQHDPEFIRCLNSVRIGKCSQDILDYIKSLASTSFPNDGIKPTILTAVNRSANEINDYNNLQLPGEIHTFDRIDDPGNKPGALPKLRIRLSFKIGSQVMLIFNISVQEGLVNGARGVIVDFNPHPVVKFSNLTVTILPYAETICVPTSYSTIGSSIDDILQNASNACELYGRPFHINIYTQYPLVLAWAITIHKSQGLTIDRALINCHKIQQPGMFYTALSRVKDAKSVKLYGFTRSCIRVNIEVVQQLSELIQGTKLSIRGKKNKKYEARRRYLVNHYEELRMLDLYE